MGKMLAENKQTTCLGRTIFVLVCLVLSASFLYLFYRQALLPPDYRRLGMSYGSDLPFHIKFAVEGTRHYSIYYYILRLINKPFGGVNAIGCSVFLTLCVWGSVLSVQSLLKTYGFSDVVRGFLAVLFLFTASIALPVIFPFFYYGQLDTQPWHNGPYLLMRISCIPLFLQYIRMRDSYLEEFSKKDVACFIVLSCLSVISKPSFIMALYPVALVELIADCIKTRGRKIGRQFLFGVMTFPSLGILFCQWLISFGGGGSGSGTGIMLGLSASLIEVVVSGVMQLLFGLVFPLYVLWSDDWRALKKAPIRIALGAYMVAFLETILLQETGSRAGDGNFGWAMPAAAFVLFIYCVCEFFSGFSKKERWNKVVGLSLLALHFGTGILYYILILLGEEAPGLL